MTADPRAVEIIADALWRLDGIHVIPDGPDEFHRSNAEALLAKFRAAGWSLLPPGGQTRDLMRDMELVAAQLDRTARGRGILRDLTSTHVADAYHKAAMRVREALATHRPPSDTPGEPAASHLTEGSTAGG